MVEVVVGLGSNLGDREKNICLAINLISKSCEIVKESSIIETLPFGITFQPLFLNSVILIKTDLGPGDLFSYLRSIELKLKREKRIKNAPRVIDLDILFYGNLIVKGDLNIPHLGVAKRVSVLEPLNEICPDLIHPVLNKSIKELYIAFMESDSMMAT